MKKSSLLILLSILSMIAAPYFSKATTVCIPSFYDASYGCTYLGYGITSLVTTGYGSTGFTDATGCGTSSTAGYENRYGTSDSVAYQQGTTYTISVTVGSSYMNCQVWIDFNNNNTFEASESVGGSNDFNYTGSISITMPLSAATGFHRMRVFTDDYTSSTAYPSINPCGTGCYYGDVRDYMIRIVPLPACTGTPTAGTASSAPGTVCPSESFTLSLAGTSFVGSLAFQWQSSPDSSTWTNITSATANTLTTTETATKYYRCKVLCTASTDTGFSNGVKVNYISVCYCTPSFTDAGYSCSTYGMALADFDVNGESSTAITDGTSCDGSGYEDHTAMSCTFMQSVSYLATLTAVSGTYQLNNQVWIDFNDNGTFETSESVGGRNTYRSGTTDTLRIPMTARTGTHRMRVVQIYEGCCPGTSYPGIDPCTSGYYYGEARDYDVTIVALPPCSGMPSVGTLGCSTSVACPSTPFTLSLSSFTVSGSLDFVWQASSDSVHWSTISGVTNTSYTTTESSTTYYRVYVTCTVSGSTDTSAGYKVPYMSYCYCIPTFTYASLACTEYNFALSGFDVFGESSTSILDSNNCDGTGYQDRTSLHCTFMQSVSYLATVISSVGTFSTYSVSNQVWIDFNDNGTFEGSESVGGRNGYTTSTTDTLNIPLTATLGSHRMRIVQAYSYYYPSISSCPSPYNYGEARDYTVNIIALPPCSGTPTAGTVTASTASACPSASFGLTLTGFTVSGSLSFVWESSTDSVHWSTISGASTTYYSTTESVSTYYRVIVTCTVSGLSDTSTFAYVPYLSYCYCVPSFSSATASCSSYGMTFSGFHVYGESSTSILDNTACDGSGYEDHTALSCNMMQSVSYLATIIPTSSTYTLNNMIWIDLNNNGTFESSECVGYRSGYSGTTTENITIPLTASVGSHRMRIVQIYASCCPGYSYSTSPSISSCPTSSTYYYGEVRDYTVNIVALPACSGTPAAGTVGTTSATACPSYSFTLSTTGYTVAGSLSFVWQSSSDSIHWSTISGATNTSYTTTETASTYFRIYVICTVSGSSDTSAGIFIPYVGYCYCTPSFLYESTECGSSYYNFTIAHVHCAGEFGTEIVDDYPCDGTGYENHTYMYATYMQTRAYTDTIISSTGSFSYPLSNQVWIDFNNDGTFDATETVAGISSYSGTTATAIDTLSMSSAAALATSAIGTHRMRVIQVYNAYGAAYPSMSPCPTAAYPYYYGEARDYTINLVALPACSAAPTGGTATSSTASACPAMTFTLSTTGSTIASGLTYQWQSSSTGTSGWTNITGATSPTYSTSESAATYFRLVISCTATSTSGASSAIYVAYVGYCYCTPFYSDALLACEAVTSSGYGMGTTGYVTYGVASTSIIDHSHCNGVSNYENLTGLSVTYLQSSTYSAKIYDAATSGVNMDAQVWIDFNDNGTFEMSESVGGYSNYLDSATFNIYIPAADSAPGGSHRMRCVTSYHGSGHYYPYLDPCTSGYYLGDARDYSVNISASVCTGTPTAGSISASPSYGCTSFSSFLSLTGGSAGTFNYQWQSSADGSTWTSLSGATASTYSTATITSSTYFRAIVTCSSSGMSDTSASSLLTVYVSPTAISGPTYVCSGASVTFTSTPYGGTWTSGATGIATIGSSTGVITGVATGTASITYTLSSGCSVTGSIIVNPTPAAISGSASLCIGTTTTLTDASTGGTWSSSSTAIATVGSTGIVSGVSAGTVTISYTLPTGCSGPSPTTTRTVVVNPTPSIYGSFTVCVGYSTTLTGSPTGGSWVTGSPSIANVDASGDVHGISAGTAIISYVSTAGCPATAAVAVNSIVTPTLAVSASPGLTVCAGTDVTFSATASGTGSSPTYVWSVNGVTTAGGTSFDYTPADGDIVSCRLLSTAVCAVPDSIRESVTMTVNPIVTPSVTVTTGTGSDTVCLGSAVTLSAVPSGGGTSPTYAWWINGSSTGTSGGSYTYIPSEGDVITVRMISDAPCLAGTDTAMGSITLTISADVTPGVTITSTAPGSIACAGTVIYFTANPTNGGTAPTYQWRVNSTTVGSGATYSYTPSNGDTVSVTMTSNFPCLSATTATTSTVITVEPVTTPTGTVSVMPGYILYAGETATFNCAITGGGGSLPTYQWTINGSAVSGATNATFVTSSLYDGDIVCCIVSNTDPCSGSATFNCITITIGTHVGVTQVNGAVNVNILPNPNKGAFTIKGSLGVISDENITIEVTDVLGQVIYSEVVKPVNGLINEPVTLGGKLANGMYLVNVKSDHLNKVFHFVVEQ